MSQILSTSYFILFLSFLSIFAYYVSKEMLKNIQEENIFNLLQTVDMSNQHQLDQLMHFSLTRVYTRKYITDAAIYELRFLISLSNQSYSNATLSTLYGLMGQNLETLQKYNEAMQYYSKAISIYKNNKLANKNLTRLITKRKSLSNT